MKEIYSILNDLDAEVNTCNREELTKGEKNRMKRQIKNITGANRKVNNKRKGYVAIAACTAVIAIAVGSITFNDAAYAAAKSIAWRIGDFLGIEKDLQDYTTVVGTTKTYKGYAITLNEVILDKDQLVVSSSVQSKEKISAGRAFTEFANVYINGKVVSVAAGGSSRNVDDYTHESVVNYELDNVDTSGSLDIQIIYSGILKEEEEIEGKWDFRFTTDGAKLAADTTRIALNRKFELSNGSKVILTEYTSNNVGQKIYFELEDWDYRKDPMYDLKLIGKDDLDNDIEFELSYLKGKENSGRLNISSLCDGIGKDAKLLTLRLYGVEMPEKSGRMSGDFQEISESFTVKLLEE